MTTIIYPSKIGRVAKKRLKIKGTPNYISKQLVIIPEQEVRALLS